MRMRMWPHGRRQRGGRRRKKEEEVSYVLRNSNNEIRIKFQTQSLMQHWQRVRFQNEPGIKIEIKIKAAIGFGFINTTGHEQISGVMIPFRLDQAFIKCSQLRIGLLQLVRENLEFLATAPFNEAAADQVIDR